MKKRNLSLTVAVAIIMTVLVLPMPVTASVTADTAEPIGANAPSLTDSEAQLLSEGYVAYVTHSSITAKTAGAVNVDGTWAKAFEWLTPGDTTRSKFDAFFELPYDKRSGAAVAADYVEYDYGGTKDKNYLTDTAWGYVTSLDGAKVVFLKDVYCIGPTATVKTGSKSSDKCDVIEESGAICIQKSRSIDGNGHTLYMEGPIISGNGVAITVDWNDINIQTNSASGEVMFNLRSSSSKKGSVNFTNCTLTTNRITAYSGVAALFHSYGGKGVDVSLTDCKVDFDASVYDSSIQTVAVFHSRTGVNYTLDNCEVNFTTRTAESWVFWSHSSSAVLNADLTNVKIDTTASAPNAHFFKGGYTEGSGNVVDMTDCDVRVVGFGCYNMNKGFVTVDGSTRFQTGREAVAFNGNSLSTPKEINVNGSAKIVAPRLVVAGESADAVEVKADHSKFYYASIADEESGLAGYSAPTLIDGASVRTNDDSRGIRFTATDVNADADDYGMLINKGESEPTLEEYDYKAAKGQVTVDGGSFTVALTGNTLGIADKYSARTYATYKLDSEYVNITVYSSFDAEVNSRSLGFVADAAVKDLKNEKDAAGGYIYEVLPGRFSRYGRYQYSVLQALQTEYANVAE